VRVPRIFATVLLVASACGSAPLVTPSPNEPITVTRLRPEPAPLTFNSGMTESRRLVVRDEPTWRQTWSLIWRNVSEEPPLPHVDFTREIVVVAALGQRPTGGYSILVDGAARTAEGLSVRVRATSPGSSCATTQALTQAVDAARVPLVAGAVTFEERSETRDCAP
jgi:protease stability complex PrcB-like protein